MKKELTRSIIMPVSRMTEQEMQNVIQTAKEDGNHGTYGITHVVLKEGLPIGHLSIAGIPTVLAWMHTERANHHDCRTVWDFYENKLREVSNSIIVPCMTTSPFYKHMERAGFIEMKNMAVFMKGL
jgi:hypothetical protein